MKKKFFIFFVLFISNCQTPPIIFQDKNDGLNIVKTINNKIKSSNELYNDENLVKKNYTEKIKRKKEKIDNKNLKQNTIKSLNNVKEKKIILNLQSLINKNSISITSILGRPDLIIRHGITSNFQYHLKDCYVDLFFINKDNKLTLNYYDFRPYKINANLNKEMCKNSLSSLVNK